MLTQAPTRAGAGRSLDGGARVLRFPAIVRSDHYPMAPGLWRYLRAHRSDYDILHAHNYHALPALAAALVERRSRFERMPFGALLAVGAMLWTALLAAGFRLPS